MEQLFLDWLNALNKDFLTTVIFTGAVWSGFFWIISKVVHLIIGDNYINSNINNFLSFLIFIPILMLIFYVGFIFLIGILGIFSSPSDICGSGVTSYDC